MPYYDYICDACQNIFEEKHLIAERKTPEGLPCPSCGESQVKLTMSSPGLADPVRLGRHKPPEGFREVLHKIHEKMPGSQLNKTAQHF
jgi:putative FmdB family regulatory protein